MSGISHDKKRRIESAFGISDRGTETPEQTGNTEVRKKVSPDKRAKILDAFGIDTTGMMRPEAVPNQTVEYPVQSGSRAGVKDAKTSEPAEKYVPRFVGRGAYKRDTPFKVVVNDGQNYRDVIMNTPEAHDLLASGYSYKEAERIMAQQALNPEYNMLGNLSNLNYRPPEVDPTAIHDPYAPYTTPHGTVIDPLEVDLNELRKWRNEPENKEAIFRMQTGMSTEQYEQNLKNKLRKDLSDIKARAEKRAIEHGEQLVELVTSDAPLSSLLVQRVHGLPGYTKGGKDSPLITLVKRALGQLDSKTKKDKAAGDSSSGLWRGIKNNITAEDFFSIGYLSIFETLLVAETLEKHYKGEPLTETELDVIKLKQLEEEVQAYIELLRGGKTRGQKVGEGVSYSIPYMMEFAATGGVGSAFSKAATKGATKAIFKQGYRKWVEKSLVKGLDFSARALAMTPLQAGLYNNYFERTADQYVFDDTGKLIKTPTPVYSRAWKSFAETYTEVFSEQLGEVIGLPFRKGGKMLANKIGLYKYFGGFPTNPILNQAKNRIGWHGWLGEFGEEMAGNLMSPLLTGEPELLRENFSADNVWTTFLTTGVMSAGFTSLEIPSAAKYGVLANNYRKRELKALNSINNTDLKNSVYSALRQPSIAEQAAALARIDWKAPDIDVADFAHVADYANNRTKRSVLKEVIKADGNVQQFLEIHNAIEGITYNGVDGKEKTDMFVYGTTEDGVYAVVAGDYQSDATGGSLIVADINGNIKQIARDKVRDITEINIADYLSDAYAEIVKTDTESNQVNEITEEIQDAIEAGIPETVIEPALIDSIQTYVNGDEITTVNGDTVTVTGRTADGYSVEFQDGTHGFVRFNEIAEIPLPDIGGHTVKIDEFKDATEENSEKLPNETAVAEQVPEIGEIPTVIGNGIAEWDELGEVPTDKNGDPDFSMMSPVMLGRQLEQVFGSRQEAHDTIVRMLESTTDGIASLKAGKPKTADEISQYAKRMSVLNADKKRLERALSMYKDFEADRKPETAGGTVNKKRATEPKIKPTGESIRKNHERQQALGSIQIKKKSIPYIRYIETLGDVVSIEDVVLRDIASGLRFAWNDSGVKRGLATELGLKRSEDERRARIGIIAKNGITVDNYAERLYFDYGRENGGMWNIDDMDIRNAVIGILQTVTSPKQAYLQLRKLHEKSHENDYAEYLEEKAQYEEHIIAEAIDENYNNITPEDVRIINELFAENFINLQSEDETERHDDTAREQHTGEQPRHTEEQSIPDGIPLEHHGRNGLIGGVGEDQQDGSREPDGRTERYSSPHRGEPDGGRTEYDGGGAGGTGRTGSEEIATDGRRTVSHDIESAVTERNRNDSGGYQDGKLAGTSEPAENSRGRDYTHEEQEIADRIEAETEAKLHDKRNALKRRQAEYEAKKREIGRAVNEDSPTLFGTESTPMQNGNLFAVERDLSGGNIKEILTPLRYEIDGIAREISELEDSMQKRIDDAVNAHRMQLRIDDTTTQWDRYVNDNSGMTAPAEYKHTKTGQKYYSVKLKDRIDRSLFLQLKNKVKDFNSGFYSLFSRSFLFKTEQDALNFIDYYDSAHNIKNRIEAAESEVNANPTDGQKKSGNYRKGHIIIHGFDVTIENPKDTYRSGIDENGREWTQKMYSTYGYIKETKGKDGDHIDVMIGDTPDCTAVFVVDQINPDTGVFDEHKIMLGYETKEQALSGYLNNYEDGWAGMGGITATTIDNLKSWLENGTRKIKPFAEYAENTQADGKQYGTENKIVTAERYEELKKKMRDKLSQFNALFDPELLAIGTEMALFHIEAGARKFAEFSSRMVADLGDAVKPYLKAFYFGALNMPETKPFRHEMDDYHTVEASETIIKSTSNDGQTKNTAAVIQQAEADAAETEVIANSERSPARRERAARKLPEIDDTLTDIDEELRLLGYYDTAGSSEKDEAETGNRKPQKKFKADLRKFSKDLAIRLGWEHDTDKHGRPVYADINIAPAGGDGTIILWMPDSEYGVYISVPVEPETYNNGYSDELKIQGALPSFGEILWRITTRDNKYSGGTNKRVSKNITTAEFAEAINKGIAPYRKPQATDGGVTLTGYYDGNGGSIRGQLNAELEKYSRDVALRLGWEHNTNEYGKPQYAHTNIESTGGKSGIYLWAKNSNYGVLISIGIKPVKENGVYTNKLEVKPYLNKDSDAVSWTITNRQNREIKHLRQWESKDISSEEIAEKISAEAAKYIDNEANNTQRTLSDSYNSFYEKAGIKFQAELNVFGKTLAKLLGWEQDTDTQGNFIPAELSVGNDTVDGSFYLWPPNYDCGAMVNIRAIPDIGTGRINLIDDPNNLMYAIVRRDNRLAGLENRFTSHKINTAQLAEKIKAAASFFLDLEAKGEDRIFAKDETKNYLRNNSGEQLNAPNNGQEHHTTDTDVLGDNGTLEDGRSDAGRSAGNGGQRSAGTPENNREQGKQRTGLATDGITERGRSGRSEPNNADSAKSGSHPGRNADDRNNRGTDDGDSGNTIQNSRNNRIEPDAELHPRGQVAKIKANIKAIKLAKKLSLNGSIATPEQMYVLRQYTGWGGISSVFKEDSPYYNEIKELLTDEEYDAAMASTTTSFYTPAGIINSVWDMIVKLGFRGGNILEPSAGIGHFFGLIPEGINNQSKLNGIELDVVSRNILKLLYPDAEIKTGGFEEQRIQNNSFDLIVTNVPFGKIKVHDKFDKDLSAQFDIHDYFIAKSVRKLKPGGIAVFITATSTMDRSDKLRQWVINEGNADFIDAVRLNTDTFKNNAGTETSSDIIIIRKRGINGQSPHAKNFQDTVITRKTGYTAQESNKYGVTYSIDKEARMIINGYYEANPGRVSGVMKFGFESGVEIRPNEQRCVPSAEIDQNKVIAGFIEDLPENIHNVEAVRENARETRRGDGTKEGGLTVIEGEPYIIEYGVAVKLDWGGKKIKNRHRTEALKDYLTLKEVISKLLDAENNDGSGIEDLRRELNIAYDLFVSRYGYLTGNISIGFLRDDVDFPSVAAVEDIKDVTKPKSKTRELRIEKSDIFKKRVIDKTQVFKAGNIKDAIQVSIYEKGIMDIPFIASLLGITEDDAIRNILDGRLGFVNPGTGLITERNEYLSGNVRAKYMAAEQANAEGSYNANMEALIKVMPNEIPIHLIKISLGGSWIPLEVYQDFFKDTFAVDIELKRTSGDKYLSKKRMSGNNKDRSMGVEGAEGSRLAFDKMNNKATVITKKEYVGNKYKTVVDEVKTAEAANKQTELNELFESWCKQNEKHKELITTSYNEVFNCLVPYNIDVSGFDYFPNASHLKKPREHQKEGVMRGLRGATLLAHEVGTGKTITLISTAMEMRRLGIAKKPCIVVQRSTYEQFVKEIKTLYPNAKVLSPSAKDLTAAERMKLYAKIAYNDWDIVVLYHSYLDSIPDSPERISQYIDEKIQEKLELLEELKANSHDNAERMIGNLEKEIENLEEEKAAISVKQKEKTKANAGAKIKKLLDRRTDETMTFEELGIDALLIDEADYYKRLGFVTSMQNIKGIDTAASQKAQSARLKTSYILENNNGKNVVFATGTPISNTMAEMWTFLRYLLPKSELERVQMKNFDAFVNNFGTIDEAPEFTASGKFKITSRFSSYSNVPELLAVWKQVTHTVLTEDVPTLKEGVGTPRIEGGKPQDILLEQTPALKVVMRGIKDKLEWFDRLKGREKLKFRHIPLVMFGLAKRAAIDVRLVDPTLTDHPNSKLNNAVREIAADLEQTKEYKGTVAVFCDSYQSSDKAFNVFSDIKTKLINARVPEEQIAIIHEYDTDRKKLVLFDRVNSGEVRVVLGTTEKLGVGVNMQERLHLEVHLDAPIRPRDYQQRVGRIVRQGNKHLDWNIPVKILRLGVKQTLDVTGYQRLQIKEKFINQIMKGDMSQRSIEETDLESSDANNFSAMMATLSGSQAALALSVEQNKLRKLNNAKLYHEQNQIHISGEIARNKNIIATTGQRIGELQNELNELRAVFPDNKVVSVGIGNKTAANAEDITTLINGTIHKHIDKEVDNLRKNDLIDAELKASVYINEQKFNLKINLIKNIDIEAQRIRITKDIHFSCAELPELNGIVHANMDNFISYVNDYISGRMIEESILNRKVGIEKAKNENEFYEPQLGQPFAKQAELEASIKRVDELQAKMAEELAEIEAQEKAELNGGGEVLTAQIDLDGILVDEVAYKMSYEDDYDWFDAKPGRNTAQLISHAGNFAAHLNTPVNIIRDIDKIEDGDPVRLKNKRKAKGWYDRRTGQVYIVIPNINDITEVEATILHEVIGHKGMVEVFGSKYADLLKRVWENLDEKTKYNLMRKHRTEAAAADEYIATLAEGNVTPPKYARMIAKVRNWINATLGIEIQLSDNDIAYMLWRSKKRLTKGDNLFSGSNIINDDKKIRNKLFNSRNSESAKTLFEDMKHRKNVFASVADYIERRGITRVLLGNDITPFAEKVYNYLDGAAQDMLKTLHPDIVVATKMFLSRTDLHEYLGDKEFRKLVGRVIKEMPQKRITATLKKYKEREARKARKRTDEVTDFDRFIDRGNRDAEFIATGKVFDKRSLKHHAVRGIQDEYYPVKLFQRQLEKQFGFKANSGTDLYNALNHWTSVADATMKKYKTGYITPLFGSIAQIRKHTGYDTGQIINYIACESALERHPTIYTLPELADSKTADWNIPYAENTVRNMRTKTEGTELLENLWRTINDANVWILDTLVNAGLITPEDKARIRGYDWRYYVPLMGWDLESNNMIDALIEYDFGDLKRKLKAKPYMPFAEGRDTRPFNPVVNMIHFGMKAIIQAKRNEAMQYALRLCGEAVRAKSTASTDRIFTIGKIYYVNINGNWMPVSPDLAPDTDAIMRSEKVRKEIRKYDKQLDIAEKAADWGLYDQLERKIEALREMEEVRVTVNDHSFRGEVPMGYSEKMTRSVEIYVNGVRNVITFADPAVARAINGNRKQLNKYIDKTIGNFTRWLAAAFTSLSPAFILSNAVRDIQHAAVFHALDADNGEFKGFVKNLRHTFGSIYRGVTRKGNPLTIDELNRLDVTDVGDRGKLIELYGKQRVYDTLYDYFVEYGGQTGFVYSKDIYSIEKDLKRYVALNTDIGKTILSKSWSNTQRLGVTMMDWSKAIAEVSENCSRFATFLASLDSGKPVFDAVTDAKNITVNFNRRGEYSRHFGQFYIFFNATVQAMAQEYKIATENIKKFSIYASTMVMKGFITAMIADWAMSLINGDGDDDRTDYHIPRHVRSNNLVIPFFTTKGYAKIPLPQGLRMYHSWGTLLYDTYNGELSPQECANEMILALWGEHSPMPAPENASFQRTLMPSVLTPLLDSWENRDVFGRPIGKTAYNDFTPLCELGLNNANKGVKEFCRLLNRLGGGDEIVGAGSSSGKPNEWKKLVLEWNPSHIQHTAEYYAGGTVFGGTIFWNTVNTITSIFDGDKAFEVRELPVLNRFLGTAYEKKPHNEYYRRKEELERLHIIYNSYLKEDNPKADDEVMFRNEGRYQLLKMFDTERRYIIENLKTVSPQSPEYDAIQMELSELLKLANRIDGGIDWKADDWETQLDNMIETINEPRP